MLDDCGSDVDSKAVLRAWLEPQPAFTIALSPEWHDEHHLWHATTSTTTLTGTVAADIAAVGGFWAATVPFLPDGHVSTAIAESLKPVRGQFRLA